MYFTQRLETFYIWSIRASVYLIAFLPLFVIESMLFPHVTGRNIAFRVLVEFAAALSICLMIINRRYWPRRSTTFLAVLIFSIIVGLTNIFGVNPSRSFWSSFERMDGYITLLHLALYFVILQIVFKDKKEWFLFLNVIAVASVLVSIFSLYQHLYAPVLSDYGDRLCGTVGNPLFLASYLFLSIALMMILIAGTQRKSVRMVYALMICLNTYVIYLTASRGPMLVTVLGVIVCSSLPVIERLRKKHLNGKLLVLLLVLFLSLPVLFVSLKNADFVLQDSALNRLMTFSLDERLKIWKYAWEGIKARPVQGWGQENFVGVYMHNSIPFNEDMQWADRAHNIVLDWLVNAGIPGLLAYLAVIGTALYALRRACLHKHISTREALMISSAFVLYFIHNLFTFDTINTYIIFFSLLAYTGHIDSAHDVPSGSTGWCGLSSKRSLVAAVLTVFLLVSFICVAFYLNYRPLKAMRLALHTSTYTSKNQSFSDVTDAFGTILSYDTFGKSDMRHIMYDASKIILRDGLVQKKGALEFVRLSIHEMRKEKESTRYDLEHWTRMIDLYKHLARYDKAYIGRAEHLVNECLILNPAYQWLYAVKADLYMLKSDYNGAYGIIEKLAHDNKESDIPQLMLAYAAILTGRDKIIESSLNRVRQIRRRSYSLYQTERRQVLNIDELRRLAASYMQVQSFTRAIQIYKEIIRIFPDEQHWNYSRDIKYSTPSMKALVHFELAKIYLKADDKKNATHEAEIALELDHVNFGKAVENMMNHSNSSKSRNIEKAPENKESILQNRGLR